MKKFLLSAFFVLSFISLSNSNNIKAQSLEDGVTVECNRVATVVILGTTYDYWDCGPASGWDIR